MKPTEIQGQWKSVCPRCGTVIWGSMGHKPTPADLQFQDILEIAMSNLPGESWSPKCTIGDSCQSVEDR